MPSLASVFLNAIGSDDRTMMARYRARLEAILAPAVERTSGSLHEFHIPRTMGDEDLVNALAQYLDLDPVEKQALLERESLHARIASLVELLEMKMMMARTPGL